VARHIVLLDGDRACYVQWRTACIKGQNRLAEVQYVSDPELFRTGFRDVSRHLLLRHRMLFTVVEERVSGGPVRFAWSRSKPAHKMFKSATLTPDDIDYLYSEVTASP
jgi:hypothetical protein